MKRLFTLLITCLLVTPAISQHITWDDLQGAKRPKGAFESYQSQNGTTFKAGTKLKIGRPSGGNKFTYIDMVGVLGTIEKLDASYSNSESEIVNFRAGGNTRMGVRISAKTKAVIGMFFYTIDLENAIETGEVLVPMSKSDQALAELKRAKEKLDLGLISQEEYDDLKEELREFIK